TRTAPKGIDKAIQRIQEKLYGNLGFQGIDGYGRIYPIIRNGKTIPAHFITGDDYKDVLFNDKESIFGNFFFYEDPVSKTVSKTNSALIETKLNIVFQLDTNKITNDTLQRNDEEIRGKIEMELRHTAFDLEEITRGLKALEDF